MSLLSAILAGTAVLALAMAIWLERRRRRAVDAAMDDVFGRARERGDR
jgi:HAMP domain-containing protein